MPISYLELIVRCFAFLGGHESASKVFVLVHSTLFVVRKVTRMNSYLSAEKPQKLEKTEATADQKIDWNVGF